MSNTIIHTDGLTKTYATKRGAKPALDHLSLDVRQGEVFGYLGPNGAGKTTTIRLRLDFIRPTAGSASIFGKDVRHHSVALRQRMGYLPGELSLWDNLTALEIMQYFAKVRGNVNMAYAHQLAERLEFDTSKKIRTYSTGNKRKIGLILALMHKPELLVLDEPTSGLDPLMQQVFIELMHETQAEGRTVFVSSHMLSEVQAICDRVGIIRAGKLQTIDTVASLTQVDFRWVNLRFREPILPDAFAKLNGVRDIQHNGADVRLRLHGDIDPLLKALDGRYVVDFRTEDPTLEEIFLTFYGNDSTAHAAQEKEAAR
jgi:ABC-2 type transport system ATP-binding protein